MRSTVLIFLLFFGCGASTRIEYHEVDRPTLNAIAGDSNEIAYAKWDVKRNDFDRIVYCDVYLLPVEFYKTTECYTRVLEHEQKHCYEFNYHLPGESPPCPEIKIGPE
jgi:hypothetical protein